MKEEKEVYKGFEKKNFNLKFTSKLKEKLRECAKNRGVSVADIIRFSVFEFIKKEEEIKGDSV